MSKKSSGSIYRLFWVPRSCCLLFCLFIFPPFHAAASSLRFEHLTIEDGLSQTTVRSFVQDSQGFMWIGTSDGLNRYDGYNLKVFKYDPDDSSSISNNRINALYEDTRGVLWVGTHGGGLNRFEREQESFIHYRHDPGNSNSLSGDHVSTLHEDTQGNLWVGTYSNGLNSLDRDRKQFSQYRHDKADPSSLNHDFIRVIYEDSQGVLWVGTGGGGLDRFDQGNFIHYRHNSADPDSLSNDYVSAIQEDSQGTLWVGTDDSGLNRLNPQRNQFFHYRYDQTDPNSLISDDVRAILEDQRGRLWIGTKTGLSWFDRNKQKFTHHQHDPTDLHSLSNGGIMALYEDKHGSLWIGTNDSGLNYFNPITERFNHYHHSTKNSNSLSDSVIYSILEDKQGLLWVGTVNGILNQFDPGTNQFKHFQYDKTDPHSLTQGRIRALYEDRQGTLWIGTYGGLNRFDPQKKRFDRYYYNEPGPDKGSNRVLALHEDREGALWVGTHNGLNRLDPERQSFTGYRHEPDNPNSLGDGSVNAFFEDSNGTLWAGGFGGLNRFDRQHKQFRRYRHDDTDTNSLSLNYVTALYESKPGMLWVGTFGGGLNRFDIKSEKFTHYREKDGLANDVIYAILEDDSGHLWISTNKGLSKFDPISEQFENYNAEDGLQSNEFNSAASFKSQNGELFFGGINGFNRFFPEQIKENQQPLTLAFTDFRIFNQTVPVTKVNKDTAALRISKEKIRGKDNNFVLQNSINATKHLTLSHHQSLFSLEFSALDFKNPKRNQYAYKLEGWDQDWIYTNYKNRLATYTNIPPGDYNLKVKASNKHGIWNEEGVSMAITILPPWWLSTVMKITYLILSLLLLVLIFYRLTIVPTKRAAFLENQVKDRTAEIKQLLKLNSQFTQNISHSLKTPLTLILGPIERMINDRQASASGLLRVKRNALRLQKDVDLLVAFSSFSGTSAPDKNLYDLAAIGGELVENFQDAFVLKKLSLSLDSDSALWVYAEADALERVLVNLLENAMKYTPAGGKVSVVIRREEGFLVLRISDTGVGIPIEDQQLIFERGTRLDPVQNQPGTGIGLAFVKEILQRNNGTIEVESKPNEGTTFIVCLPESTVSEIKPNKKQIEVSTNGKNLLSNITMLAQSEENIEPALEMGDGRQQEVKPQILVVEDDKDMRTFIVESFVDSFSCLEAGDGEEGLSLARIHLPDLIISDIMMPRKSGQQMLRELKADPKVSHIPVILVTAAGDQIGEEQAIEAGAIHYFSKPFNEQDIKKAVSEALDIQAFAKVRIEQHLINGVTFGQLEFPFIEQSDISLLNLLGSHIQKHYADPEFTNPIKALAPQIHMEERRLRRKLVAYLDHNPSMILRDLRLEQGCKLLASGIKASQVYLEIGFSSQEYFGRCFKTKYGQSPAEYQKKNCDKKT